MSAKRYPLPASVGLAPRLVFFILALAVNLLLSYAASGMDDPGGLAIIYFIAAPFALSVVAQKYFKLRLRAGLPLVAAASLAFCVASFGPVIHAPMDNLVGTLVMTGVSALGWSIDP